LTGDSDDIFICHPSSLGAITACALSLFFNGDTARFNQRIDGFGLTAPLVTPTDLVASAELASAEEEGTQFELAPDESDQTVDDAEVNAYDVAEVVESSPDEGQAGNVVGEMQPRLFLPVVVN
jgi:hypothetical protein